MAVTARVGRIGAVTWFVGGDGVGFGFTRQLAPTANATFEFAIRDRCVDAGTRPALCGPSQ